MEETSNLYKIHDSDCSILYQIKVQNYISAMRSRSTTVTDEGDSTTRTHTHTITHTQHVQHDSPAYRDIVTNFISSVIIFTHYF